MQLQDYVNTMSKLQVDEHEYAYLKAIALFSPGKEKKNDFDIKREFFILCHRLIFQICRSRGVDWPSGGAFPGQGCQRIADVRDANVERRG